MTAVIAVTAALLLAAPPTTSANLTLDEALARAAEANRDLRAARSRLEQARAELAMVWSRQFPQVGAGATWVHNGSEAAVELPTGFWVRDVGTPQGPPAGGAVPGAPTPYAVVPSGTERIVLQRTDQLGARVDVSQVVIAPGLWFAIDAAELGARATERGVEAVRQEVLFGVAQAYYTVASLGEGVDVARRLLEIASRHEEEARIRHLAGTTPRLAVVRAEVDRARAEADLVRAANARDAARIALALLLDVPPDFDVSLPPAPATPAPDEPAEDALRARPDVAVARLGEAAAGALRRSAVAAWSPTLGAFARYQRSNARGFTGEADAWYAGLSLDFTVFDGGLREATIRRASARVAEASELRQGVEARARAEVEAARLDVVSARAAAAKSREQRDAAAENLALVGVSARAGASTSVDEADATSALRNAESALRTDELAVQLASLRLLKAMGAPPRLAP